MAAPVSSVTGGTSRNSSPSRAWVTGEPSGATREASPAPFTVSHTGSSLVVRTVSGPSGAESSPTTSAGVSPSALSGSAASVALSSRYR